MRTFEIEIDAWGGGQGGRAVFKLFPTGAEDLRIARRVDELAAEAAPETGPRAASDLRRALEQVQDRIRDRVNRSMWPDGRPPDAEIDDDARREWSRRWSEDHEAPHANHVGGMLSHLEALAAWPVLIVEGPGDYADLANAEIPSSRRAALARAFLSARQQAETDAGKPQPSGT